MMSTNNCLLLSTLVEDVNERFYFGIGGRIFCRNIDHEIWRPTTGSKLLDMFEWLDKHWNCGGESRKNAPTRSE